MALSTCTTCGWKVGSGHRDRCAGTRRLAPLPSSRPTALFLRKYGA